MMESIAEQLAASADNSTKTHSRQNSTSSIIAAFSSSSTTGNWSDPTFVSTCVDCFKLPENLELLTLTLTPDDTEEEKKASEKQLQIGGGAATPQVSDYLGFSPLNLPQFYNLIICCLLAPYLSFLSNFTIIPQVIQLRLDATPLLLPFIPTVFGEAKKYLFFIKNQEKL